MLVEIESLVAPDYAFGAAPGGERGGCREGEHAVRRADPAGGAGAR